MRVPGDLDRNIGYVMTHRIAPNGGGTRVNQYTLAMDVFVATTGPGAASLLADQFAEQHRRRRPVLAGQQLRPGHRRLPRPRHLHRRRLAPRGRRLRHGANPPVVTKYVDGIKQHDWTANQGLDNARRALQPTAILFADGDQDERREMWVNSVQIRAGKLSDAQIAALGGPSASGIPIATPSSTVTGPVGLQLRRPRRLRGQGPDLPRRRRRADQATGTKFGTTGVEDFADVPNIGGTPAQVMYVPGDLDRNIGYVMEHLIAPNGGGTRVNQYTLILDVLVAPPVPAPPPPGRSAP
jgi:hypothetical protein